jgi:predicted RNase H-like HicB family nuclease
MSDLKETVTVNVEYFTGKEEGDEGTPYFVSSSDDLMFTTDGETFEELLVSIRECLELTMKDGDPAADFGVSPVANVKIVMELPEDHAQTA